MAVVCHQRVEVVDKKNGAWFAIGGRPSQKDEVEVWRHWMRAVFQPLNVRMEEIIIGNPQLLIEERVPRLFIRLISHAESYKATIAAWDKTVSDDQSTYTAEANTTLVNFDNGEDLEACITDSLQRLNELREPLQRPVIGAFASTHATVPAACEIEPKKN